MVAIGQKAILSKLERAQAALVRMPEAAAFAARAQRLTQRIRAEEKLVAVFGAFSAGKSSLINALTGDAGLIVSPNPTTATVSRLGYADDGRERAVIHAKTAEQLFDDVSVAFAALQVDVHDLHDASERAKQLKMAGWSPRQRRSVAFLKAFADGYAQMASRLGQTFEVPPDQVAMYTAQERIACFINHVDILQTQALFAHGLSLVDTPGVDSIHRRHTDVAFRYMQEADAIVFVLYYTHAFSRADKDFVMQLAGVQDVAQEDKLFVVLNAVDLASSEDERLAVQTRVVEELRRAGIPKPRIYAVSSQLGYAAKKMKQGVLSPEVQAMVRQRLNLEPSVPLPDIAQLSATSGIEQLSTELLQFTEERFDQLVSASATRFFTDAARFAAGRLDSIAVRLAQGAAEDAKLTAERADLRDTLQTQVSRATDGQLEIATALSSDWNELLFHAGDRIRIRFSTLLREAFHSGRFRHETKVKESLRDAVADLVSMLERQIDTEARTLQLRMQKGMERGLETLAESCREALERVHVATPNVTFAASMESGVEVPPATLTGTLLQRAADKYFRSPKQFFEGGGQTDYLKAVEGDALAVVRAELERIAVATQTQVIQALSISASDGWRQAISLLETAGQEAQLSVEALQALQQEWENVRTLALA